MHRPCKAAAVFIPGATSHIFLICWSTAYRLQVQKELTDFFQVFRLQVISQLILCDPQVVFLQLCLGQITALEEGFEEEYFGSHVILSPDGPGEFILVNPIWCIPQDFGLNVISCKTPAMQERENRKQDVRTQSNSNCSPAVTERTA